LNGLDLFLVQDNDLPSLFMSVDTTETSIMTPNDLSHLLQQTSLDPAFPPELFLEIFSHASIPTLARLCRTSLTFLELATPLLYRASHIDNLPKPSSPSNPRSPQLSLLLPSLALSSVRILHLTLPKHPFTRTFPPFDLPRLDHLVIHHSEKTYHGFHHYLFPWSGCDKLLAQLDPRTITFSLSSVNYPYRFSTWTTEDSIWHPRFSSSEAKRLERVIFRGGLLYEDRPVEGPVSPLSPWPKKPPLGNGALRMTFDLRLLRVSSLEAEDEWQWVTEMAENGVFELPLASDLPILIRTSSKEVLGWVENALSDLGKDEHGVPYRDRVDISWGTVEEAETERVEMKRWRRRGEGYIEYEEEDEANQVREGLIRL
jgi:hypothetical protein